MNGTDWFAMWQEKDTGLVLGGGGARGCYEIGLWQALAEQDLWFSCAAGTSIGALVAAMYVCQDLPPMVKFVDEMHPQAVAEELFDFPESFAAALANHREISGYLNKYIFSNTGMNISPLRGAWEKMFNYSRFAASTINYACMTFNLSRRRGEAYYKKDLTAHNAAQIILASAACYPAFPVETIDGQQYIDGGYWDNVPVDLAVHMGAKKILAVNVQGPGVVQPVDTTLDVFDMKPILPLGSFLDFSQDSCRKAMRQGYLETRKMTGTLIGLLYAFAQDQAGERDFWQGSIDLLFSLNAITVPDKVIESTVRWSTSCSSSDLLYGLLQDQGPGCLVECLAWLCHLDAEKIWTYDAFLQALLSALEDLRDTWTSWKQLWKSLQNHELDHRKTICVFYGQIVEQNGEPGSWMNPYCALYPAELALAWTWYFLEVIA